MLITQEQDTASKAKRVSDLEDFLHRQGQETDSNDNTLHAHPSRPHGNLNEMDNACVTNLACLKLSGQKNHPRPLQKFTSRFGHLNELMTPGKTSPGKSRRALFISSADDNDAFRLPSPSSPTQSPPCTPVADGEKQEVLAGRLYLIRQIGNASHWSGPPSSPSRGLAKPFSFSPNGLSSPSPSSSPPSSTSQSPTAKRKLPVYVRVYRCHKDHFALVSRDSSYSSRHAYLNMRHCRVFPGGSLGRFIVAGNSDAGSLMEFESPELASLERWLDALQTHTPPESPIRSGHAGVGGVGKSGVAAASSPSSVPKSPGLPTLTEADEEDRFGGF